MIHENLERFERRRGDFLFYEDKFNARRNPIAQKIVEDPKKYDSHIVAFARYAVRQERGNFKCAGTYGAKAGSYAGASLWVLEDSTFTVTLSDLKGK